jgi:undecaprenyl-diphosphatase
MTTFQAIVYSIVHGFSEFLPVSSHAHHVLVAYALGWNEPSGAFLGALSLGALLALTLYFRHDWASIFSSFIQVLVFRKRPMTLDERLTFFLFLSSLPSAGLWYYLRESGRGFSSDPAWMAAGLAAFALPLWLSDRLNRRNKGMFDWNGLDALLVGLGQALLFVPGCDRITGTVSAASSRNYGRDAIAKYVYFASGPLLAASAVLHLRGYDGSAGGELSWATFSLTVIVTCLAGLLSIGGFMKHVQRKGFAQYATYRILLATAAAVFIWYRSTG